MNETTYQRYKRNTTQKGTKKPYILHMIYFKLYNFFDKITKHLYQKQEMFFEQWIEKELKN